MLCISTLRIIKLFRPNADGKRGPNYCNDSWPFREDKITVRNFLFGISNSFSFTVLKVEWYNVIRNTLIMREERERN